MGHEVFTGAPLLGGRADAFLAVDRWDNPDGMALYDDPAFGDALGGLFSGPPVVERFGNAPTWYGWGSLDAADDHDPRDFVVVRGRLRADVYADAQAAHDAVASAGEGGATGLGDLGHVVYLGVDDWREFLAIDVWGDDTNLEALYTDPTFGAAFATVFDGTPTLEVYRSTDWYQW